jgi:hypothetical protein
MSFEEWATNGFKTFKPFVEAASAPISSFPAGPFESAEEDLALPG